MAEPQEKTHAGTSLGDLYLPDTFSLCELIAAVERSRETTIEIQEFPDITPEEGLFGIWLNTKYGDFILHARTSSELHRQQIILHELAHMILSHDLMSGLSSAASLFPDFPTGGVARVLARGHTDSDMEQEAESLADRLASSMRRGRSTSPFEKVFA